MWRCFVRDQARVPSVAGAVAPFFVTGTVFFRLVSLVGWVCSSRAQKEEKNSTTVWSVSSLDTPSSAPMKSWLVVARSASAPLRLVGHLGWVHRQEARAVGRPRERMMPHREALTPRRDRAGLARKTRSARGGSE